MAFTLAQLAAEVNNDPSTLGLVALKTAGSDQAIADALNLVRATITGINRNDISAKELMAAVVLAEYTALTQANRDLWQALLTIAPLDAQDTQTRTTVGAIFGTGTTTRTNLQALASRTGSRAEQLWGTGTRVTALDVSRALARPGVQ
jgi:hypothetical protein